jgi:Helix-turn-helix domain
MGRHRREKVFGPGRRWTATPRPALPPTRGPGRPQPPTRATRGPITRAFLDVLGALLWGFHNSRSGCCFSSYEAIAAKAECARSTVAEALKALEWAGILTWQNRITRILVRERDLFGRLVGRWQVIRTSNAYVFADPQAAVSGGFPSKSEKPPGTQR